MDVFLRFKDAAANQQTPLRYAPGIWHFSSLTMAHLQGTGRECLRGVVQSGNHRHGHMLAPMQTDTERHRTEPIILQNEPCGRLKSPFISSSACKLPPLPWSGSCSSLVRSSSILRMARIAGGSSTNQPVPFSIAAVRSQTKPGGPTGVCIRLLSRLLDAFSQIRRR